MKVPTHTSNRILYEALMKRDAAGCFCPECATLRAALAHTLVPKILIDEVICPLIEHRTTFTYKRRRSE